ncbi:hypothetical protein BB561_002672 [Smittium simulii]|uniref:NAD(P)-binding domain-containing protein n=1 Tax=Smittium simulii TaxID=133385 RepID=A0A2T9YPU0_9FUNG|nr:hypothetical protein BB561_002672 [Smittium simulii]
MSSSLIKHKILVVGGGGYIGSEICRTALRAGHQVTALCRSGSAKSNNPENKEIQWVGCDVFEPETYRKELESCDTVVHSMGLLMENDYKKIVNYNFFKSGPASNPQDTPNLNTYERINRDSALILAEAASKSNIKTFVFISAHDTPPFVDDRYITSKREAEKRISEYTEFRSVFLRPSLVYDSSRPLVLPIAFGQHIFNFMSEKTPLGCIVDKTMLKKWKAPPVLNSDLAQTVVSAIENANISGIIDAQTISQIRSNKLGE